MNSGKTKYRRLAFVVPASAESVSGPRNSVTSLAYNLLAYQGVKVSVFSTRDKNRFSFNGVEVEPIATAVLSDYDMVVFSGVWMPEYLGLARRIRNLGIPYIISPRSSLMKSQFLHSFYKKAPFLLAGGYRYLKGAKAIHFLSEDERLGSVFNKSSFVASNALSKDLIDYAIAAKTEKKGASEKSFGFLGRYTPHHKGLDLLLKAVLEISPLMREAGWKLYMHGSDNRSELASLENFVKRHELSDLVNFGGPLHGTEKWDFLQSLDVFVHTSRYEGQPQAVMEAMVNGACILVTPGANMSTPLQQSNCGVLASLDPHSIAKAMEGFILGESDVLHLKQNAHTYACKHYAPNEVAKRFLREVNNL